MRYADFLYSSICCAVQSVLQYSNRTSTVLYRTYLTLLLSTFDFRYILYFLTIEYVALYFYASPPRYKLLLPSSIVDVAWLCGVDWVWTGVDSRYATTVHYTTHYTLFPLLTVVPVPLFLRTQSTTTKQQHKQSSSISKIRNLHNFTFYNSDFTLPSPTPSITTLFSGPTGPSAPLHLSVCSHSEPTNSPAFHLRTKRAFASKVRAFETPALTTSLRSLTKLQVRS